MRHGVVTCLLLVLGLGLSCGASDSKAATVDELGQDLLVDGKVWLRTMVTPFEKRGAANREKTYKVYTHILDFAGKEPITKGAGGKYTHHRGLFIGWKDTLVGGKDFDTWHMSNCYQQLAEITEGKDGGPKQVMKIDWSTLKGEPFIKETRTIAAKPGADDLRVIDFTSHLESVAGPIQLRGDLQHAGMQVRMANEVSEHEDSTQYTLPEGATEDDSDQVVGAWWTCCSPVVRGERYWLVHMTPPDHAAGIPVYSIRQYARFGAFWEPDLAPDKPLDVTFRVVVSKTELDRAACQALYDAYAESR